MATKQGQRFVNQAKIIQVTGAKRCWRCHGTIKRGETAKEVSSREFLHHPESTCHGPAIQPGYVPPGVAARLKKQQSQQQAKPVEPAPAEKVETELVMAKVPGIQWWPGYLAAPLPRHEETKPKGKGYQLVVFFGEQPSYEWLLPKNIRPYNKQACQKPKNKDLRLAHQQAEAELQKIEAEERRQTQVKQTNTGVAAPTASSKTRNKAGEEISEYEKMRLETIEENERVLQELEMFPICESDRPLSGAPMEEKKSPKKRKKTSDDEPCRNNPRTSRYKASLNEDLDYVEL